MLTTHHQFTFFGASKRCRRQNINIVSLGLQYACVEKSRCHVKWITLIVWIAGMYDCYVEVLIARAGETSKKKTNSVKLILACGLNKVIDLAYIGAHRDYCSDDAKHHQYITQSL